MRLHVGRSDEGDPAVDYILETRVQTLTYVIYDKVHSPQVSAQVYTLVPPTAVAGGDEGFVFEFEASDNNNSG
jgi:hypothetical protein